MTRGNVTLAICFFAAFAVACGESTPKPKQASTEENEANDKADIEQEEHAGHHAESEEGEHSEKGEAGGERKTEGKKGGKQAAAAEPEFKEGMSVKEAMAVVPAGTTRVNIDTETLSIPLQNADLYAPCKLSPSQHFKVTVAVWNGKAVGIDITSTPANKKVEECVTQQIRSITWHDKVPSLNTVEFSL